MSLYVGNDTDVIVESFQLADDFSFIVDAELALTLCSTTVKGTITGASNVSPIVITSVGHGLSTGDEVMIRDVLGNLAANGPWTITAIDADTFSLDSSAGSGAYETGGTWYKAIDGAFNLTMTYSTARKRYKGVIPASVPLIAGTRYRRFVTCTNYGVSWETDLTAEKRR